jgi:uncharacterized protein YcfJ
MFARLSLAALLMAGAVATSNTAASANDTAAGALIGGATGAIIGGAVTGRAGGAVAGAVIGGVTGAAIGNQSDRRRARNSYYYWSGGRCMYHYPNGRVVRVDRGNCY